MVDGETNILMKEVWICERWQMSVKQKKNATPMGNYALRHLNTSKHEHNIKDECMCYIHKIL